MKTAVIEFRDVTREEVISAMGAVSPGTDRSVPIIRGIRISGTLVSLEFFPGTAYDISGMPIDGRMLLTVVAAEPISAVEPVPEAWKFENSQWIKMVPNSGCKRIGYPEAMGIFKRLTDDLGTRYYQMWAHSKNGYLLYGAKEIEDNYY